MYKRVTALLLAICLLITAAPATAGAADTQAVSVDTASVYQGSITSVTLRAEDFKNIASLEVYLYYDASALRVNSTYNGSLLSGAQTSVNTSEAGTIKLVTMALDGISGYGDLLTIYFAADSDCAPGKYPITVAIGGAYDTELAPVTVGSSGGSVTVLEQVQTESFYIYGNYDYGSLQKGDTLTYRVANSSYQSFVSADFVLEYDHEVFAFESATLEPALTNEGAIYSVNSSVLGQVRITYASVEPVSAYELFRVRLKVLADADTSTQLQTQATNVYREDLSAYLPGSCYDTFWLTKLPEVIDHPNAFLKTEELKVGQQSPSVFTLESGAGVAAADFTVRYDPSVLRCVSVTAAEGLTELGGMVIINDNYAAGTIRFSYINMNAYSDGAVPIVKILWEPLRSPAVHYQITGSGVGVVDAQQNAVALEYVTGSGCIYAPTVTPPTCLEDGYTTFACACGDAYKVDIVDKLGHDIGYYEAKKETCTEIGWEAYEGCSRCNYGGRVEIPALGHDEIFHEARTETCTGIGWESYVTCSRCDYSTYQEIAALGHRVIGQVQALIVPVVIENNDTVPFVLSDGVYYSQNHEDGSSSNLLVRALYNCTLELTYGASSEQNYDQLYIYRNDMQLDAVSGIVTDRGMTVELFAGDVLTVCYSKDGSVANGEDRGWVRLECEPVWSTVTGDVPAETGEPTCTEAVVCHYCQTVVKKELGHDAVSHEGSVPTCTEAGWAPYETCKRCDYSSYTEIPALGHDEITHEAQVQTCTGMGWGEYVTCSRCDYSTYAELPALGHRVMELLPGLVDPLTVQNDGAIPFEAVDGVYYSQNHGDDSSSEFTVTAVYDCTVTLIYSVSSETNYDKLVLLLNGSQLDMISGTVKNKRRTVAFSAGDVLTVRYTKDGSAANGEDRGWLWMEYEQVLKDVPTLVPAQDKEPTCTQAVICAVCDAVVKQTLPHDEIHHEGKAATCLESGWEPYVTCRSCDYTTYKEIPALDHDLQLEGPQAPTCTNDGYEVSGFCTRCDYVVYVGIPALGHDITQHAGKTATCTEIGWNAYKTCSRCDYTTYKEIPALGHSEITHSEKAETCTEIGWKGYVTCSRCDYTTYREIPALGHDEIHHAGKEATGQENGWEPYVTCSRCDYTTYKEIPALGHDLTQHAGKAATCLEAGWTEYVTCSRCDYSTYREIPALGHSEITHGSKAPTCTEIGWEAYVTCSRCDYSTYRQIEALKHAWTEKHEDAAYLRAEAANCTECDTYWYGCSRCGGISDTDYFVSANIGSHSFTEKVKDDAHRVPGTENPAWYYYDCAHCNTMGTERFCDVQPGDLTADTVVDEDDVIYLLRHVLMPGLFPANQSVDYNGDSFVNEGDAIHLLRHLLLPDFFPLQ